MVHTVRKRHVFYLSGFDPRGPAFYRRLYHAESEKQSHTNGMRLTIGERLRPSRFSSQWQIHSQTDDHAVQTSYEFLRWDDIIRQHWQRNELVLILRYLQVAWFCAISGMFSRILKTAWPPFVAATAPLLLIALLGALGAGLGWIIHTVLTQLGMPSPVAMAAGVLIGAGVIYAARIIEQRLNSLWLLRIYAFTRHQGAGALPDLDARLDAFACRIKEVIETTDSDEVLVVGHSTGTMIAISALARALHMHPKLAAVGPRVSLMTLGHCIPILSFQPDAQRFRNELKTVADAAHIDWIDFTAPSDGACFALIDPVAAAGITADHGAERKPKVLSARFATLFLPQTYAGMKRNWYRHHFQYLMAGEKNGDYDYFAITAGSQTLGARYQTKPSVVGYTGLKIFS